MIIENENQPLSDEEISAAARSNLQFSNDEDRGRNAVQEFVQFRDDFKEDQIKKRAQKIIDLNDQINEIGEDIAEGS